jgi:glycine betaine/proline transport system permease protein
MIAVGGLGQMVLRGIGRLDMGLATVGGIGIVLMAIVLDRMTQSMGKTRGAGQRGDHRRWFERGPVGVLNRLRAVRSATAAPGTASTRRVAEALR